MLDIISMYLKNLLGFDLLQVLGAVNALLLALIAFFVAIPGEQPEKALKKAADFLAKFSKK